MFSRAKRLARLRREIFVLIIWRSFAAVACGAWCMGKRLVIAEKPSVAADIARALGGFTVFLLGLGPGMMMLPALWCAPLAYWHRSWRSAVRRTLIGVALVDAGVLVVLALATAGMDPGTLAGVVLFIGVYVTITWVAGATLAPHERVLADVGR